MLFLQVLELPPERLLRFDASGHIGLGVQEALLEELAQLDQRRSFLAQKQGRLLLEGLCSRAFSVGVTNVERLQRHGELVDVLREMSFASSMLVMGRIEHAAWGGHAQELQIGRLLRAYSLPILVVTGSAFTAPTSFVLAYDGSAGSTRLLGQVAISPLLRGLRCQLVQAGPPSSANEIGLRRAAERLRQAGFEVAITLEDGEADDVVCNAVARVQAGLMVLGLNSRSRSRQMVLGRTSTLLIRSSSVPVLAF